MQDHVGREGTRLKHWRPRKNSDGSYDLVFKLAVRDEAATKHAVTVPEEFHGLLEREYFSNHLPDEDEDESTYNITEKHARSRG